jgi:hypothetical protein
MPDNGTAELVEPAPCLVCGEMRPQSAIDADDPYCSAGCCREAYRVPEPPLYKPWELRRPSWVKRPGPGPGERRR